MMYRRIFFPIFFCSSSKFSNESFFIVPENETRTIEKTKKSGCRNFRRKKNHATFRSCVRFNFNARDLILQKHFLRRVTLRWNSSHLIGWKWSRDFYQPIRMLKFPHSVELRRKFLYRIGSARPQSQSYKSIFCVELRYARIRALLWAKNCHVTSANAWNYFQRSVNLRLSINWSINIAGKIKN